MKIQAKTGPQHVIKNWKFQPQHYWFDKTYKSHFLEVFPHARVTSAKVGNLKKIGRRIYREGGHWPSSIPGGVRLCRTIADRLAEKVEYLKNRERIIVHEQDSHEFALPFLLALNSSFGAAFKVLSLDQHLDAMANEFAYMSFWKFAIANKLMEPRSLMILGPLQLIWAKEFISFFPEKDRKSFASRLMKMTPAFEDQILFVYRNKKWRDAIREHIEAHLPDMERQKRLDILSSMMVFETSDFAYRLRSFWEAEGLRRKGVLLELPPSFTRSDRGIDDVFAGQLKRVRRFAANENLLISFDADLILNPERLFELADAIAGAGTKRIALNVAGLDSRHIYPVRTENSEIREFISRIF